MHSIEFTPRARQLAGAYRLRVGPYLLIFIVDEQRRRIPVREIGHRGSIY
jgi:mRNA-degrading endonuclease RelE of RelBE toxin-antitoxin system